MVDVTTRLLLADTDSYPDPYLDPAGTGVSWKYFGDDNATSETLNTNDVKRLVAAADAQGSTGGVELAMTGKAFAVLLSSRGAENAFFAPVLCSKSSVYQDRLGTHTGNS